MERRRRHAAHPPGRSSGADAQHTIDPLSRQVRLHRRQSLRTAHPELNDEQALRGHLLDQVIVVAYSDPIERARITYWLGWLADHMNTQRNGPTRDLLWWEIPGWIRRWQLGLVGGSRADS